MKQVSQRPGDGAIKVDDVPRPSLRPGWALVANRFSLISAGTERSKITMGEKSLLGKARARPDLVRKVVDRARTEGVRAAVSATRDRLNASVPLGYSSAGVVLSVGDGVELVKPGDAVACAGAGWANHADIVAVPELLLARVPAGVDMADAAYTTVGAIALHAVRQSDSHIGERIGVIGLGLVGQLVMRLLAAAGSYPFGIDPDDAAVHRAKQDGLQAANRGDSALASIVAEHTQRAGFDAIIVAASTQSSDPIELAARIARERATIVIVGDVPISVDRALLYEKELDLRLSRSYGPGRYDRDYEERGRDLPLGYVRWTEQRNLQAFLDLIAAGRLKPSTLTTHRLPVGRADEAYAILSNPAAEPRPFGILLEYAAEADAPVWLPPMPRKKSKRGNRVALIGAGAFARSRLLPALRQEGAHLAAVVTSSGLTAADVASRFGFDRASESPDEIFEADDIDAVVIATRHDSHAGLVTRALQAGKAVFVEKPLALDQQQLCDVEAALFEGAVLMVGFNRRFAPLTERLLEAFAGIEERVLTVRVNAGPLSDDHWLHDPEIGGGRLLGEGCHFIDLLGFLAEAEFRSVHAFAVRQPGRALGCSDSIVASIEFDGPCVGSLIYSGNGDPRLPKERIEVFGGGLAAVLDDFRRFELYRSGKRSVVKATQDKGVRAEVARFLAAVAGREEAPSVESYVASTRATLALVESLQAGERIPVL